MMPRRLTGLGQCSLSTSATAAVKPAQHVLLFDEYHETRGLRGSYAFVVDGLTPHGPPDKPLPPRRSSCSMLPSEKANTYLPLTRIFGTSGL